MTKKEKEYVADVVQGDGFDYAFRGYTDSKDKVKDTKFHKLRKAYIKAIKELEDYTECNKEEY